MAENIANITSVKDFSDYYHDSIALSLEKIHNWRYELNSNPAIIISIRMELDSVYKKIHSRINKSEDLQMKKYMEILDFLRPVLSVKKYDRENDRPFFLNQKTKQFKEYKKTIFDMELHMWDCLNRLGMTSKHKKDSRLLS